MASLLCPSPIILDQSFPRDEAILRTVGKALGELQGLAERGTIAILLTDMLKLFVRDFDWNRAGPYPLLMDIHNLLVSWCLQPNEVILTAQLEGVGAGEPHPLPDDCKEVGNAALWAEEAAKLLYVHDAAAHGTEFFIGIACPQAFAGLKKCGYPEQAAQIRKFPLLGPCDLAELSDAFTWEYPNNLHLRSVSYGDAKRNVHLLGGTVAETAVGSHYKVSFMGAPRPWVLDYNEDPVKDSFVGQLVPITGFPFEYVKTVLLEGRLPRGKPRIRMTA
jgi:hypothetical protein